jgi:hypothetical protein
MGVVGVGKARDAGVAPAAAKPLRLGVEAGITGVVHADAQAVGSRWESIAGM